MEPYKKFTISSHLPPCELEKWEWQKKAWMCDFGLWKKDVCSKNLGRESDRLSMYEGRSFIMQNWHKYNQTKANLFYVWKHRVYWWSPRPLFLKPQLEALEMHAECSCITSNGRISGLMRVIPPYAWNLLVNVWSTFPLWFLTPISCKGFFTAHKKFTHISPRKLDIFCSTHKKRKKMKVLSFSHSRWGTSHP